MDISRLVQKSEFEWWLEATPPMRVPGILYASEALLREMDDKVLEQIANVASLPGIVQAAYAMPDAHWGYGFPIGGWRPSAKRTAWSRRVGWASTSPAGCGHCTPA